MRKIQLFLVTCFLSVSFFALTGFYDSNALGQTGTGQPKECKKRTSFSASCLLFQDMNFYTYYGYTNTTSYSETGGTPTLPTEIKDTEVYGIGIGFTNKKFLAQYFIDNKEKWEGGRWDFLIDPIELNAGVKFSRVFEDTGQILTRELTDETSFEVKIVYNLPVENLYRNIRKFWK